MRIAAAVLGLGAGLAAIMGGCTDSTEPGASEPSQAAVQVPSLDLDEPGEFQTASFAFG